MSQCASKLCSSRHQVVGDLWINPTIVLYGDHFNQRSYQCREEWFQQRQLFLASVIVFYLAGFSAGANHRQLIVRNRLDVVTWSPEEIVRRWLQLCAPSKPAPREVAETPSPVDLDPAVIHPARVANREDQTTGRMWHERFTMQRLFTVWWTSLGVW
jgi:hypothetical protein